MLTFTCNICLTKYDAQVAEKNIVYLDNNKRLILQNEDTDCHNCREQIKLAEELKRQEIRARKI
jgi:hypothetical protein